MAVTITTQKIRSLDNQEHTILKVIDNLNTGTSDEVSAESVASASITGRTKNAGTAGVVVLEGSPVSGDAATWITLATLTFTAANQWKGADATNGLHGCRFLRARISTQISNGQVDVYIGTKS